MTYFFHSLYLLYRSGYKAGHQQVHDGVFKDGLEDAVTHKPMGVCGDDCAARHGISRKDQDDYAVLAYKRAAEATSVCTFFILLLTSSYFSSHLL